MVMQTSLEQRNFEQKRKYGYADLKRALYESLKPDTTPTFSPADSEGIVTRVGDVFWSESEKTFYVVRDGSISLENFKDEIANVVDKWNNRSYRMPIKFTNAGSFPEVGEKSFHYIALAQSRYSDHDATLFGNYLEQFGYKQQSDPQVQSIIMNWFNDEGE